MPVYRSAGLAATLQPVTGPGYLRGAYAANNAADTRYLYIFDGLSAAGTLIAGPFPVPPKGAIAPDFAVEGSRLRSFTTGLFLGLSSALWPYTVAGADAVLEVEVAG